MKPKFLFFLITLLVMGLGVQRSSAQNHKDSSMRTYKNVVRYNLSGALLFGFSKYIVLGYERVL